MNGFKDFISEYKGAIIGAIIAILILLTELYKLIIGIILIGMGIFSNSYYSVIPHLPLQLQLFQAPQAALDLQFRVPLT